MSQATIAKYQANMVKMMSYLDNQAYNKDEVFTEQRRQLITAEDVLKWLNFRCFGDPDPPSDQNPDARHHSLEFWKKSISYFMPNSHMPWNEISRCGNPTRSRKIGELLKKVKKKQVRGQ